MLRSSVLARSRRWRAGAFARRVAAASLLVGAALVAGCGDDGGSTPAVGPTAAVKPVGAAPAGGAKNLLAEKVHVEDRVSCPIPERPSDPKDGKCDPKAPSCPEHLYCTTLAQGSYCEPCPERDGIRHAFKDRDFAVEQNRDPFQSFLLPQFALGKSSETMPIDPTTKCPREDQLVATSYSYADLKLVGIVAQGTQRKVLMMGGPLGYIIKRGDCVGKEKAVVKDIGTGYITFVLDPDGTNGQRAPEEHSVQLNPKQLALNEPGELPSPAPKTSISPVVPPAAVVPGQPSVELGTTPGTGSAGSAANAARARAAAAAGSAAEPPMETLVPKKR